MRLCMRTALWLIAVALTPLSAPAADAPPAKAKPAGQLPSLKFAGVEFEKSLAEVCKAGAPNVVVNWSALHDKGVERTTRVTVTTKAGPPESALNQVLAAVNRDLRVQGARKCLYVTTRDDLEGPQAFVQWPGGEKDKGNAEVYARLSRAVANFDVKDVDLGNVFDFVKDALELPLEVQWDELAKVGIKPETKVSLELHDVNSADVLYWVLRPLRADLPVGFAVRKGTVIVSSIRELEKLDP